MEDEDTFEIDIYGDAQPQEQPEQKESTDMTPLKDAVSPATKPQDQHSTNDEQAGEGFEIDLSAGGEGQPAQSQQDQQLGTKRKHEGEDQGEQPSWDESNGQDYESDDRPLDPGATPALKLADLHWWTTEEDLRAFCAQANAEQELRDLAFGEHKINGKSKGEAYLEFGTPQAATAVKRLVEQASQAKEESGLRKTPFTVVFSAVGNPHRTPAAGGAKKEYPQSTGRGGAYNNYNSNRGNFGGRGGFNNRGGYNNNNGMMQSRPNAPTGGWGMNNFGGNFGAGNMMNGGYGGMGMGNFNMSRGGMMNNMGMMGRGGFGAMGGMGGMGNMNMPNMNMGGMMGGRGGGMMGGRGGWNGGGGYQQTQGAGFNGGMQQGGGVPGNKRAKME